VRLEGCEAGRDRVVVPDPDLVHEVALADGDDDGLLVVGDVAGRRRYVEEPGRFDRAEQR
jgi:hypothetical protein